MGSDPTFATYAWASFVVAYQPKMVGIQARALRPSVNALLDAAQLFSCYLVISIFNDSING